MMKVLLADDHILMLQGLGKLLEAYGVEVAGTARNGLEAVEQARLLKPDVILMDVRMPVCDGIEATRRIRSEDPSAKIVMLTTSFEDHDLFEAVRSGACGYLLKSMDADDLIEALEQATQGVPPFSPGLANRLLEEFTRLNHPEPAKPVSSVETTSLASDRNTLTDRQLEVLRLVAEGLSYKEIGARLNLSPATVKYHMHEILQLLHLGNRAQALAWAGHAGLREKTVDR